MKTLKSRVESRYRCSSRFVWIVYVLHWWQRCQSLGENFDLIYCKMATGEIPAPGVFHGDKRKDKKNHPPMEEEM